MNSPPRSFGYKTGRIMKSYDGSYDNKTFIPSEFIDVNGYECVLALPTSYFYRMDLRRGFRGANRNTYFGINPTHIMNEYKTHTHLFVVTPNTSIVLINMNILKNVKKLMESASEDIKTSIRKAFPINGNIVKRISEPPSVYDDNIDHDRRVLEYICSLPNIDGYYVTVGPLHPEIGFCEKSIEKLNDVDMFLIRPEASIIQRKRQKNVSNKSNENKQDRKRGRFNNTPSSPPEIPRDLFGNLQGGKRKTRRNRKLRKTQKKQSNRK